MPSKRFRTPTYVENSGRLLYDHSLSQRHKSKHGGNTKDCAGSPSGSSPNETLCDEIEATRASEFPQSTRQVMANTTDALIGALARKSQTLPTRLTDRHVLRVVQGRSGVVTLLRRL